MYITVNTTFISTCYILNNKCCTWLRMTRHVNGRNQQGKRGVKREWKTDWEKERKTERKKERVLRQDSDKGGNWIHVHYTKDYIYKYMLYTYQQVLHLIENDESY